ncbi:MAG TPA: hypothetical protein VMT75_08095 [Candidatus Saccharimonadales bacterium]|nr:hypothetical protein [Candidatus Saccharimonadales bacterium]
MRSGGGISIWFFIGISLFVNGVLIFGAGVYQWFQPPQVKVVLFNLHASVWWGAFLAIVGAFYCLHYRPGKVRG